ncbi:MAB_1171c family putative transporter [Streptomyces sp. NBC_00467]|uniref:MAB_1171c family putative transporter n=1 Tax=Streptomyces sp. NBC_00467 TaxID=2975752 RepID=UPI002E193162
MRNTDYYLPSIALGIAFVAKLPMLLRGWRDPLVLCVLYLLVTGGIAFFFAAPPTIGAVNDLTGIPNVSAPLVYCVMCSFSAACLVLIVNWRGGPPKTVARHTRRWVYAYATVIVALPVLFILGSAPVERLRDLDTYYANTPFIREMIVTYLAAHLVGASVTATLCVGWARKVTGWLRLGLIVLSVGFVADLVFCIAKLTAVGARWTGRDWDFLSTNVAPPVAAVGALVVTIGFVIPLVGPRLSAPVAAWSDYMHLAPLWRHVHEHSPSRSNSIQVPWWSAVDMRLTMRETSIHDELLRLQPYLDDEVRRTALAAALAAGAPAAEADVVSAAAMVSVAVENRAHQPEVGVDDHDHRTSDATAALTATLAPGRIRLLQLSQALQSPFVTAARVQASAGESRSR